VYLAIGDYLGDIESWIFFSKVNGTGPLGSGGHPHTIFSNGRFYRRQSSFGGDRWLFNCFTMIDFEIPNFDFFHSEILYKSTGTIEKNHQNILQHTLFCGTIGDNSVLKCSKAFIL